MRQLIFNDYNLHLLKSYNKPSFEITMVAVNSMNTLWLVFLIMISQPDLTKERLFEEIS